MFKLPKSRSGASLASSPSSSLPSSLSTSPRASTSSVIPSISSQLPRAFRKSKSSIGHRKSNTPSKHPAILSIDEEDIKLPSYSNPLSIGAAITSLFFLGLFALKTLAQAIIGGFLEYWMSTNPKSIPQQLVHENLVPVKTSKIQKFVNSARNYQQWKALAVELDYRDGYLDWQQAQMSTSDNLLLVRDTTAILRKLLNQGDIRQCMFRLRTGCLLPRDPAEWGHKRPQYRTNRHIFVDQYHQVVFQICSAIESAPEVSSLNIGSSQPPDDIHKVIPLSEKINFFHQLRLTFGKTCLHLSGGGARGVYHFGVLKTLFEQNILPQVFSSSSSGSIIAAVVCTKTDEQLTQLFDPNSGVLEALDMNMLGDSSLSHYLSNLKRFFKQGAFFNTNRLQSCMRRNIGDVTFLEAFQLTGRILNIVVTNDHEGSFTVNGKVLNHVTSPHVFIWSAVCASCALPMLFYPVPLFAKSEEGTIVEFDLVKGRYVDGSVWNDFPRHKISETFSVNLFIVSQVNPHIVPFVSNSNFDHRNGVWPRLKYMIRTELKHRIAQLAHLGILPGVLHLIASLARQTYKGDINIVPKMKISDMHYLFQSPQISYIKSAMRAGSQATFPVIDQIKTLCEIEEKIEACYQRLLFRSNELVS